MPRAFLITNRRYNSAVEYESRESSPERSVRTAEAEETVRAHAPLSAAAFPREDVVSESRSRSPASILDGLYHLSSLEQLAEISLATAVGHPFCPTDPLSPWGEDPHACPECGKRYSTSSNLARHRQTHRSVSDKKARKCPHCEKVYVSMPAFSMHVRTHTQGCQCPYCKKCFSRPWLLQGHIRTHTGEKPFKCPVCNKAFADKSNLRAHIQTHSDTKPFVCQRCGKAFALKSYLYKHEESSCVRFQRQDKSSP